MAHRILFVGLFLADTFDCMFDDCHTESTESTEILIAMRIVRIERIFICPAEMAEIAEILFALNVFLSH